MDGCMQYPRSDMESLGNVTFKCKENRIVRIYFTTGYTMLEIAASKELPWSNYPEDKMLLAKHEFFNKDQQLVRNF